MLDVNVSPIEFDHTQPTNQQWKYIVEQNLQAAKSFVIHFFLSFWIMASLPSITGLN